MEFSAKQIAELLNGVVEGDADVKVNKLAKIEEAMPGAITFLANPKYTSFIYETKASLVVVNKDFIPEQSLACTLVKVDNAYFAFAKLLETYDAIQRNKKGIEQPSFISDNAKIGEDVYIGAFAYIGPSARIGNNVKIYPHVYIGDNVEIADNTTIYAGVKLYANTIVGKNCILHAGCVLGADGFGFAQQGGAEYNKVAQIGNVIIEDNVEIGANTAIDRATLGSTIIRKGVKLDNLIQIAHNVVIDENTVVAAQSGIAGSTKIGRECVIGGQVGVAGHLTIADKVMVQAQTGISANITKEGEILQGSPAMPIMDYKKSYVYFRRFPEIMKKIEAMQK